MTTYENFKFEVDSDGIALVTWDMPNRSMNVLSQSSMGDMASIIVTISSFLRSTVIVLLLTVVLLFEIIVLTLFPYASYPTHSHTHVAVADIHGHHTLVIALIVRSRVLGLVLVHA